MSVSRRLVCGLLVLCCCSHASATSRSIFGIVVEVTEDEKPRVVVRLLLCHYNRQSLRVVECYSLP